MEFRRTTSLTVASDLRAYASHLENAGVPEVMKEGAARALNRHLDELLAADAFGTEGQSDPRGDHRD